MSERSSGMGGCSGGGESEEREREREREREKKGLIRV